MAVVEPPKPPDRYEPRGYDFEVVKAPAGEFVLYEDYQKLARAFAGQVDPVFASSTREMLRAEVFSELNQAVIRCEAFRAEAREAARAAREDPELFPLLLDLLLGDQL
jgi:hypothetical protein